MNRRDLLSAATGLTLAMDAAAATATRIDSSGQRPRNVLLIIADDQGYDLSCCGGKVKTPVLDGLAANGTLFTPHSRRSCIVRPKSCTTSGRTRTK